MTYREEVDHRGISHLVDEKGRCATFADCGKHSAVLSPEEMSPMALRAAMRKVRIDLEIMRKKLAAANEKIAKLEKRCSCAAEALGNHWHTPGCGLYGTSADS